MRIIFQNFTITHKSIPEGGVACRIQEAMEGEGPDGERGLLATGNEFSLIADNEIARTWAFDLAEKSGLLTPKDLGKPEVADMAEMRKELNKRKAEGKSGGKPGGK